LRAIEARDGVERRGRAGAVRADEGRDGAGRDLEADVVEGRDAAERQRQVLYLQDRTVLCHRASPPRGDRKLLMPKTEQALGRTMNDPRNPGKSVPTLRGALRRRSARLPGALRVPAG